jgi:hypothetical protein
MTQHYYASGPVQWGDLATWVGSIAALIAVTVPVVAYFTRRKSTSEGDKRPQTKTDQVSGRSQSIQQISETGVHAVTVSVQNSSDEPVYGLRAAVGDAWHGDPIGYTELDLPSVMPPGSHEQQTVELKLRKTADGRYESSLPVELIFRDASSKYWHRHRNGGLTEITTDLPPSGRAHFFTDTG